MSSPEIIQTLSNYNAILFRQIWESILKLKEDLFVMEVSYSHGSLRNQIVHVAGLDGRCHMFNHGTDHRAQILRLLMDLGAPTINQVFI